METETYKKAKEILEKFDPARFKELEVWTLKYLKKYLQYKNNHSEQLRIVKAQVDN